MESAGQSGGVPALFGRIAPVYDRMNRVLSLGLDLRWRRKACRAVRELVPPAPAPEILDLASGTGDFALELARAFPGARVTCADASPEMLEIAKAKTAAAGIGARCAFNVCSASALPFGAGRFGLVSCAFGFRNFPDVPAALAECARVLAPGGVLAVLEFTRPRLAPAGAALSAWLAAASLFAGPRRRDYAHLRRSIRGAFSAPGFIALARGAGFAAERAGLFLPACRFFAFRRRA